MRGFSAHSGRWLAAAGALLAAAAVGIFWAGREPRHNGKALSEWVAELDNHRDPGARQKALQALQEMGPEALPYLSGEVGRTPSRIQRAAQRLSPHLPDLIKRPLRKIYSPAGALEKRHSAAQALRALAPSAGGNAESLEALGRMLREPNALLSSSAATALGAMGAGGVAVLLPALDDANYQVRANACRALAQTGSNAAPAVGRLCQVITNETGPIVSSAAHVLAKIGPAAVPALIPILAHTNWASRRWAAYALAANDESAAQALPALLAAVRDEHPQVRWMAVDALGQIRTGMPKADEASAALLAAAADPSEPVRIAALNALAPRRRVIRENFGVFTNLLADPAPGARAAAAHALSQSGREGQAALPLLDALAGDSEPMVRARAREAAHMIRVSLAEKAEGAPAGSRSGQ